MPSSKKTKSAAHLAKKQFKHTVEPLDQAASFSPPPPKRLPLIVKLLIFLVVIFALLITPVLIYVTWYVTSFSQASGIPTRELVDKFKTGLNSTPEQDDNKTNFLILGTDEITGQKENSLLTDTNIILSYDSSTHTATLLSVPRDLWIDSLKTKINALYYYGEISQETTGVQLASEVISEITGLPIHYHIVVNLQTLGDIIDAIGGVTIDVPATFTDDRFPRSDVDVTTTTDPQLLYETITFNQGANYFDGQTALKYIRSRQSQDETEGTDIARSARQLRLISAIIDKFRTRELLQNPHLLGNFYKIVRSEVDADISDQDLISLVKLNGRNTPTIKSLALPIQENGQEGVIFHPPALVNQQWVYQPVDPTWQEIVNFVADNL